MASSPFVLEELKYIELLVFTTWQEQLCFFFITILKKFAKQAQVQYCKTAPAKSGATGNKEMLMLANKFRPSYSKVEEETCCSAPLSKLLPFAKSNVPYFQNRHYIHFCLIATKVKISIGLSKKFVK